MDGWQMIDWNQIRHFEQEEFGPRPDMVHPELVNLLDQAREEIGHPIRVLGSFASTGHAPNSYHYRGMAADIVVLCPDPSAAVMATQWCVLNRLFGGLGLYTWWSSGPGGYGWHVDLRHLYGERMRWLSESQGDYDYNVDRQVQALVGV